MKLKLLTLALVFAALVLSCNKAPVPLRGVVEVMAGAVSITENGVSTPARPGSIVRKNAMITTGEASFAQISVGGNMIQVYEKSSVILDGLVQGGSGAEETRIRVGEGTIFSRVKKMITERGDSFTVESCTMVAAVRGTEFLYSVDCSRGLVATYEGVVGVRKTGSREETSVPAGRMLSIESGKKSAVAPIPKNFRYRDFSYRKDAAAEESSGAGGESGRVSREKDTGTASAEKRRRALPEKKSTESAVIKKNESRSDTGEGAAAVKKKEERSAATMNKTAPRKTGGGAITVSDRSAKPGGLLEKPRMNLPELK